MRVFGRRLAASLLGLALLNSLASAATITGRVRDSNTNSYLFGANVTVRELDRSTNTTAGGEFSIGNIPAGTYTVVVSSLGFADATEMVTLAENDTKPLEIGVKTDVLTLSKFVVEGTREGQARALQQKRSASNIMDAISADAVGKFPDGNAAEALRRVPGISLEVDQDEGRYVVLRGINSALNTVTLNNQLIGTPSEQGNRGIAMDSVPADLIARLEVVKAVTPDMDANAIGGSINIVTQSAFDRPEAFFFGTAGMFYDSFSKKSSPNGSATYGTTLGEDKKWGVVAGGSYSLKNFKSQTANTRSWALVNGFYVPLTQQNYDYEVERERIGANVALQFRPNANAELALRVNHNEFSDTEGRQSVLYEYRLGTLTNQTATSGTNSQGRASRQFRDYSQTGTIDAISLDGKHTLGTDSHLSWQIGASKGERDVPTRVDWEYRSAAGAFPNTYDLSGEELVITPTTAAYYDPANYPFRRVRFRSDIEEEKVYSGQIDFKRDLQLAGKNGFWKTGFKTVSRDKADDRTNNNYNAATGANAFTLAQTGLATPEITNYFDGLFRYGPGLDLEANKAFFAANPSRFVYDTLGSLSDSVVGDLDATEDVYAGYLMASVDLNKKMNLLAGVRYEATKTTYGGFERSTPGGTFTGVFKRITGSRNYDNLLPGLHFNWRPTDKLVLRAAWTNTISRPNYADLAPRNTLDSIETSVGSGVYTGSLSAGNPNLKPYESMNFDASLEYYLKNSGIASVGVFHKRIDNPVYSQSVFLTNTTYEGLNYATLSITRPDNADSGKITGVEFNYQQFFKQLPSPFDGFGINFNYTLTDSSVTVPGRTDKLPFFKQSDRIANVALFFEKYGLEARVALSYSDDYLDAVGSNTDTDIYVRGRMPIDAKISYRINSRLKVYVEFINLSEEPLREYTGIRSRENDFEIYQWKGSAGINFNL